MKKYIRIQLNWNSVCVPPKLSLFLRTENGEISRSLMWGFRKYKSVLAKRDILFKLFPIRREVRIRRKFAVHFCRINFPKNCRVTSVNNWKRYPPQDRRGEEAPPPSPVCRSRSWLLSTRRVTLRPGQGKKPGIKPPRGNAFGRNTA